MRHRTAPFIASQPRLCSSVAGAAAVARRRRCRSRAAASAAVAPLLVLEAPLAPFAAALATVTGAGLLAPLRHPPSRLVRCWSKPAPPLPRRYRAAVCSLRLAASRAATGRAAADRHRYREPRSLACVVSDLPPRWRGRSPELLAAAAGGPSAVSVRAGRPRRGFASTAAAVAWLDLAPASWRAGSRRPIVPHRPKRVSSGDGTRVGAEA
ncbi:hypothetical protein Scep_022520 [Stephania cephalantha]|uniref:Uncharacterized protein n=1 Tax=Stephania cephalantha TaxID=152367 RepID=A0AAP0I282_9MAGN